MGESNRIEYKRDLTVDLEKETVAFLNYKGGGNIYIGIPRILNKYPKECFKFTQNFLRITFEKAELQSNPEDDSANDYDDSRTNLTEQSAILKEKILAYIAETGRITRKEATKLINLKNTKTYEILSELVAEYKIIKKGKGRSTYYVLNSIREKNNDSQRKNNGKK